MFAKNVWLLGSKEAFRLPISPSSAMREIAAEPLVEQQVFATFPMNSSYVLNPLTRERRE
jgi:hypothetical protein